jgi:sec-independent protein translocase protein TatA
MYSEFLPLAAVGLGGMELVLILAILLLLFGGSKLPSLARGLGESIKEFKKAQREDNEDKPAVDAKKTEAPKTTTTPGPN